MVHPQAREDFVRLLRVCTPHGIHAQVHTRTCANAQIRRHACTTARARTQAQIRRHACTTARARTQAQIRTQHVRAQTRMRTLERARARTRTRAVCCTSILITLTHEMKPEQEKKRRRNSEPSRCLRARLAAAQTCAEPQHSAAHTVVQCSASRQQCGAAQPLVTRGGAGRQTGEPGGAEEGVTIVLTAGGAGQAGRRGVLEYSRRAGRGGRRALG